MTPQLSGSPPYFSQRYESAHGRARVTVALLIAGAAVSLLTIPSHILDLYLEPLREGQELSDNPLALLAALFTGILGLATIAVYIATVITFLMWLYRASNNVAAFGESTQHSSGWAVGSFFVPIMNLFVPYQATKDIWAKSDPEGGQTFTFAASPPGFFAAWWGFWLVSNFVNNIYFRMTLADAPIDAVGIVGIVSEILSIAAAWFAILVVRDIDRRQTARAAGLTQQFGPAPPPPPVFHTVETPTTTANPAATTTESGTSAENTQPNSDTTGA